jgi:hypothetical protein
MTKDILGQVVKKIVDLPSEMLGVIYDLAEKFSGESGFEWLTELKKFLRKEKCWVDTLLEFLGIRILPATTEKFIAREKFVKDISDDAEVKISFIGDNFKAWLLDKVEEPRKKSELRIQRLRKSSVDGPIIAELGDSIRAKISLDQLWLLLKEKQVKGEKDGWHIAYIEDKIRFPEDEQFSYINEKGEKTVLRAVGFDWDGGGWSLNAYQVSGPDGWFDGNRVLSRNSYPKNEA